MTRPALAVLEWNARVYRRNWRGTLFLTFMSPILFLASMGFGLGSFVDRAGSDLLGGVPYAAFLAPGLLAAQAMQTAGFESTFPITGNIAWDKTYFAVIATPARVRDVVIGQLAWIALRLSIVTGGFLLVMTAFGLVSSPLGALALVAAVLTGMAFAAPITAFAATQRTDNGFNVIFRFVITPLFLFSGTFFPISQLPDLVEPIAYITPTFHGVALARGLVLGTVDLAGAALHAGVLAAFIAAGVTAAFITFRRALVK